MDVDIVVICPVEVEFEKIRKILEASRIIDSEHNLFVDFGYLKTSVYCWKIALVGPDATFDSFEIKTYKALESMKPKYIFLAGVAGGVKDVQVGDLVVGTKAYGYEWGKETADGFVARPRVQENKSTKLLHLAKKIVLEIEEVPEHNFGKFFFGPIASGSSVIASTFSESYKKIKSYYEDTLAVEMEAYPFAKVASDAKVPYLNIRGISDLIDGKRAADKAGSQENASERVAAFLKKLIAALPAPKRVLSVIKLEIFYSVQPFTFFSRPFQNAVLLIKNDALELQSDKEVFTIKNITAVEHVRMPGDFGKNWVKLVYKNPDKTKVLYLSESAIGFAPIIGGSKKLFETLFDFYKRKIMIH